MVFPPSHLESLQTHPVRPISEDSYNIVADPKQRGAAHLILLSLICQQPMSPKPSAGHYKEF